MRKAGQAGGLDVHLLRSTPALLRSSSVSGGISDESSPSLIRPSLNDFINALTSIFNSTSVKGENFNKGIK